MTIIRYAFLCIGIVAALTLLSYLYIYQTGKAAREFCALVDIGMSREKLHAIAAEKGLDVKHKALEGHKNERSIFSASPNHESRCEIIIKDGIIISKRYGQTL